MSLTESENNQQSHIIENDTPKVFALQAEQLSGQLVEKE